jgi:hypothetical protein
VSIENFMRLQDELARTENRTAIERRRHNETVQDYNTYIGLFPNKIEGEFIWIYSQRCLLQDRRERAVSSQIEFGAPAQQPASAPTH